MGSTVGPVFLLGAGGWMGTKHFFFPSYQQTPACIYCTNDSMRQVVGEMWKKRGGGDPRRRLKRRLLLVLGFSAALLVGLEMLLAPAVAVLAAQRSRTLALTAMTQAVQAQTAASAAVDYSQLMRVELDGEGRVTLLVTDTQLLNQLTSAVILDATQRLEALSQQRYTLPLGSLLGGVLLSGAGPPVAFRFTALGAPRAELEDSFHSAGVNQTRHSIYLNLSCDIRVVAPFSRQELTVSSRMLLAEGVIVGYVPDTYLSVEGGFGYGTGSGE